MIATLTIENASKRSPLTAEMWLRLPKALSELASDPGVEVLVVRGAGEEFSSGVDIRDLARIASDRATFGITPARTGIIYPLSGIQPLSIFPPGDETADARVRGRYGCRGHRRCLAARGGVK